MEKIREIGIKAFFQEDEDTLWCISFESLSRLYKIDLRTAIMDEASPLLNETAMSNAFSNILAYKDYFIFIPANEERITMLERKKGTIESIMLPSAEKKIGKSDINFFSGIIYEDFLFLFGYSYPGILRMDLVNKKFKIINEWLNERDFFFTNEKDGCFHIQYYIKNNIVYFPFMNTNAVLEFDLRTMEVTVHKVGNCGQRYISIEWDGNNFWLFPRDGSRGSIVKWNLERDTVAYYQEYPEGFNYDEYAFGRTVKVGKEVLLFANCSNMNISIDLVTGEMKSFEDIYDTSDIKGARYRYVEFRKDKILFINKKQCILWDYLSGQKQYIPFEYGKNIYNRRKKEELDRYFLGKKGMQIRESEKIDLRSLITYMSLSKQLE